MSNNITRALPKWHEPKEEYKKLRIYNSLTKQKDIFHSSSTNLIKWYNCGPTVYDASHMGHARLYVTIDYLRRILEQYFNYSIKFVMNITDIDDKIIVRARQNYLFEQYLQNGKFEKTDLLEAMELYKSQNLEGISDENNNKMKNYKNAVQIMENYKDSNKRQTVLECREVMVEYLDKKKGETVKDHEIFNKLARHWEQEFFDDMKALNVKESDVVTRVSEYVKEIILFVEKIIQNGYAYVVNDSVYFDTTKFNDSKDHYYAKLKPNQINNQSLIEEGEGQLKNIADKKKNNADFALWKKSKLGEPSWRSPWGEGRPGWHIECSAMAGEILGDNIDIHSGGIDLTFPHHDNELAQSEACYDNQQWINYFLHVGHLHINGLKMSKSLKNFITIKEALAEYSSNQLRICFLMHSWFSPMDFQHEIMEEAKSIEKNIKNFFANCRAILMKLNEPQHEPSHEYFTKEKDFMEYIRLKQESIHEAFLDSISTPIVVKEINALISETNKYLVNGKNYYVINYSLNYVEKILKILGIKMDHLSMQSHNNESSGMEYLKILSRFRDEVRRLAMQGTENKKDILELCDRIRDVDLRTLGVVLDDKDDGKALIKIMDKEDIRKQDEINSKIKAQKVEKTNEMNRIKEEKAREKLELSKINPTQMFKLNSELLYSNFDDKGMPTHDAKGIELTKSKLKKLTKEYEKQTKLYSEYLANNNNKL